MYVRKPREPREPREQLLPAYTGKEPALDPPMHWLSGQSLSAEILTPEVKKLKASDDAVHKSALSLFNTLHAGNYRRLNVRPYVRMQLGLNSVNLSGPAFNRLMLETALAMANVMIGRGGSARQARQARQALQALQTGGSVLR